MTLKEAQNILGITDETDLREVKLKFRKLMTQYHPDAAGQENPEILKKAQMINEAYGILRGKQEAKQDSIKKKKENSKEKPLWKGTIVKDAFTERAIYRSFSVWEDGGASYEKIAKGKFKWDPDTEDFDCLLKSINQAALELLEAIEHQNHIYSRVEREGACREYRFACQAKLFHLLAGQFIMPVFCMKKLAVVHETDEQGRTIYKFRGFLGTKERGSSQRAMSLLKKGELLRVVSLKDNRIMVSDNEGTLLGHLSLAEDLWYYIVIPVLKQRLAWVKMEVADVEAERGRHPYQVKVKVDLYLRMETMEDVEADTDTNQEIQAVLKEYERIWRR